MEDLSLCPRILQDHEFNREQNDGLCSFYWRTLSLIEANELVKNTKSKSTFNFLWDCEIQRQKSIWQWSEKDFRRDQAQYIYAKQQFLHRQVTFLVCSYICSMNKNTCVPMNLIIFSIVKSFCLFVCLFAF